MADGTDRGVHRGIKGKKRYNDMIIEALRPLLNRWQQTHRRPGDLQRLLRTWLARQPVPPPALRPHFPRACVPRSSMRQTNPDRRLAWRVKALVCAVEHGRVAPAELPELVRRLLCRRVRWSVGRSPGGRSGTKTGVGPSVRSDAAPGRGARECGTWRVGTHRASRCASSVGGDVACGPVACWDTFVCRTVDPPTPERAPDPHRTRSGPGLFHDPTAVNPDQMRVRLRWMIGAGPLFFFGPPGGRRISPVTEAAIVDAHERQVLYARLVAEKAGVGLRRGAQA